MNLNIELPADIANVMQRRAQAAGKDLATFVGQVVTESAVEENDDVRPATAPAEFVRRLKAWIALHPVLDHAIDDSRESFYEGRGE